MLEIKNLKVEIANTIITTIERHWHAKGLLKMFQQLDFNLCPHTKEVIYEK